MAVVVKEVLLAEGVEGVEEEVVEVAAVRPREGR